MNQFEVPLGALLQDVKYGLRMLAKNPGFTGVAVLTLALGIGANTAMFSVVNGVLLQPLPFRDPGRLVAVGEKTPEFDMMSLSYPDLVDWQKQSHSFEGLAGFNWQDCNLTGGGEPEHLSGKRVSANFFDVLGVPPVLGRNFDPKEDHVGASPVVMINAGLWKRRFGASPELIGRPLTLNGQNYTVIGVVPAWFKYQGSADLYTLLGQWDDVIPRLREAHSIHAVARLNPGITLAQAQSELSGIAARLAQIYPKTNANHGAALRPLAQVLVGDVRPVLLVLLGAVGFVLLIACANVANLLLARATGRQHEMAIRAAIGASRSRIIRQLLTESALLAVAGGSLGLLAALWGTQAVLEMVPGGLPRMENIHMDGWVLAFTLVVSLVTGVFFGSAPAIQVSRIDLHDTLKEGGRGLAVGHHRLRALLVVSEVAASLVLLVGAGLMLQTVWRLSRVDPGFEARNVLAFSVGLSPDNISTPDKIRFAYKQLSDGMSNLPGVEAAAVAPENMPLSGDDSELPLWVIGRPRPSSQSDAAWAQMYVTGPGYLHTMGIPLLRGRYFTDQDTKNSQGVTVIDELMAKGLFPGEDAVGKSIGIYDSSGDARNGLNKPLEIVGVVGHVKHWGLDSDASAKIRYELYLPYVQIPDPLMKPLIGLGGWMVMRTSADPLSNLPAIRRQASELGGGQQPVYNAHTLEQVVSDSFADRRFSMTLLGVFAALALGLAAVGIYGVISYTAGQRTHEVGIRMALGARPNDVLKLVVGQGLGLVLLGLGMGWTAAFGLTRLMSTMLYGVRPTDWLTFAGASLPLVGAAVLASYIPARRAAKVDPMTALRYE